RLHRHRVYTQFIGMASIFVTAMYGMYQNLAVVPGF
ncbi:MAG: component of SufBCD complex, partial [Rhodobacteraceae bacterium]|nr:component of SufBCD complex [Paracoccaceae bacterium]